MPAKEKNASINVLLIVNTGDRENPLQIENDSGMTSVKKL
tara:strand:+ start:369 stop:488 length:120 start_codon:yes stop_codon:yes gene_type:complete